MRKLLTAKNYPDNNKDHQEKCCCSLKPTRLKITSNNWATRNDSSYINAILHPENYLDSPCKWNLQKESSARVVKKKCCLNPNNCYCRERSKIPKPKILSRPKSCIRLQNSEEKNKETVGNLQRKSLTCICGDENLPDYDENYLKPKRILGNPIHKDIEKNDSEIFNSGNLGLELTEQRKASEQFSKDEYEEYLRKIYEYEEIERSNELERNHRLHEGDGDSEYANDVATILGTRPSYADSESTNHVTENKFLSAKDLAQFRKNHYFQTHAVSQENFSDTNKCKGGHTCRHQFRLDDRLLPEPLNKDSFGRSLCSICGTPMDGSSVSLSKSYFGR